MRIFCMPFYWLYGVELKMPHIDGQKFVLAI